jgi:hypothetical protein
VNLRTRFNLFRVMLARWLAPWTFTRYEDALDIIKELQVNTPERTAP